MASERIAPFTAKGAPTASKSRWIAPYLRTHLDAIEGGLGVSLARTPAGNLVPPLGYGEFGVALATDDGRVVKLTTDDAEPVIGSELQRLQNGSDPELRAASRAAFVVVEKIVKLPGKVRHQGHDVPVFAILREDVMPVSDAANVPPSVKEALNAHFDGWAAWFDLDKKRTKTPQMRLDVSMQILDGWDALDSEPDLAAFALVQRFFWNLGIPLMDTHRHNFGWRATTHGSQLVLFDLGGSCPLSAKDRVDPIDGDTFERYYPWTATLARIERA